MRTIKSILIALVCLNSNLLSQSDPNINLGDTYKEVVAKIEKGLFRQSEKVLKSKNKITVYIRPESGLLDLRVNEYYFRNGILAKDKMIMNGPDPDATMAWLYRLNSEANGEPTTAKRNGQKAYRWRITKAGWTLYIYVAFSDWYQKRCVIMEREL